MIKQKIIPLLGFLLITFVAAFIGSSFTTPNIASWYRTLTKPSFAPPNWLFAPVWTILFVLMAVAAFLVYQKREHSEVKGALIFYFVQLILNSLWSIIFFGLHNPQLAFFEIIVLWIFILVTLIKFYKIHRTAGLLLVPYILWVSFASILNCAVWLLN
ncbi:MAG: tryptophan-rich sensory protein [Parcubacteria group bacterium]|nr:tryptophan-rich sensory protein [Parcubacteria group bacterium]